MTCIVGFVDRYKNEIWMGGDSAGVAGLNVVLRKDTKVFKKQNMLFGYTSSFRMGQLLRFKLDIPKIEKNKDVYEYMCTDFIDSVKTCLIDNGYAKISNNETEIGTFLVGFKNRIFRISNDLQVGENLYPYDSCGCGKQYALATMKTFDYLYNKKDLQGRTIINTALRVAQDFSGGVRKPFIILKQKNEGKL